MTRFLNYLHNLRGLAILFVVGVHVGGYDADWQSHPGLRNVLQLIFDPSEGNGTVLFLFIGGFLFQHLTHDRFNYGKFLEQKFLNIILPYIIISIPLILIRLNTSFESLTLPGGFQNKPIVYQFFYHLLTGSHMPPFWFISTIVLFYFSAPVLHAIDNRTFYRYFFPLVLMITLFTYRPEHNANTFLSYVHFIPVYIAGMWASYNREKILSLGAKVTYPLLAIYIILTIAEARGVLTLSRAFTFQDLMRGGSVVFNVYMFKALVLCFLLLIVFHKLQDREMPLLEVLGHYSFGVFFVHYILISVTRKIIESMGIVFDFNMITYLIYFLFILMSSILTVYLVKRVSGRWSRYLIGS
jgi:probable poly-beta-1,6-N-acetyl-D-glucosamine export protein